MKKVYIPADAARGFRNTIGVFLPDALETAGFDASGKDFPPNLPDDWTDPDDGAKKTITWISNFGLTKSGKQADRLPAGAKYQVVLPDIQRKYVYFDGRRVRKLATRPYDADNLTAELDMADPPVGIT